MNVRAHAGVAALSLAALWGCSEGVRGPLCGQEDPCGGDVVGSWTVTHSCLHSGAAVAGVESALEISCKALTIDSVRTEHEGTITFANDLTFTSSLSARGTVMIRLPASCVGGRSCTQVGATLMTRGLSDAGCTGSASCTCPIRRQPLAPPASGTYLAQGTTLTIQDPAATEITRQYCVSDSAMHLLVVSGGRIVDDVLLARD